MCVCALAGWLDKLRHARVRARLTRSPLLADASNRMPQGEVKDVALSMAAAEPMRQGRHACQQRDGEQIVAKAKSHQCAAGRQAEQPSRVAVARGVRWRA